MQKYSKNIQTAEDFVQFCYKSQLLSKKAKMYERIFDCVEELYQLEKFNIIDEALGKITPYYIYDIEVILSILTATFPARNKLPNRTNFFDNFKKRLEDMSETYFQNNMPEYYQDLLNLNLKNKQEWIEKLLVGLRGD